MRRTLESSRSVLLLVLVAVGLVGCAGRPLPDGWQGHDRRWFDAQVLSGVDEGGQPAATLTVSIPYRNLVFFRDGEGYAARYRIRAVQKRAGSALRAKEWRGTVRVPYYAGTREAQVERRTLQMGLVPTGGTPLQIAVRVSLDGTQREDVKVLSVTPAALARGGRALGELSLYHLRDPLRAPPADRIELEPRAMPDPEWFTVNEGRAFDLATGSPWLLVRVFALGPGEATHELELAVRGPDGAPPHWSTTLTLQKRATESAVLVRLPAEAFLFGANRIELSMGEAGLQHIGLDNLGLDLRDDAAWKASLRQVEILASGQEMDVLRHTLPHRREEAWLAFWERRTEGGDEPVLDRLREHYRRVLHARRHYADGSSDGAMSDRGRIYVLRGRPDRVEVMTHSMDSFITYEVWRYDDARIAYYFQDLDGLGHYRLVWQESV